jgi:hypothetical protein
LHWFWIEEQRAGDPKGVDGRPKVFKTKLIIVFSLFAVLAASCANRYSAIPQPMRARLDERLKEFSSSARTEQYDKYYDLFSTSYIEGMKPLNRSSKDEYLESLKGMVKDITKFDDFIPRSTTKTSNDAYRISGEIRSLYKGQSLYSNASLEARWEKGDWYFSEFFRER